MKRSDMVKLINDIIYFHSSPTYGLHVTTKELADKILLEQEKAGMSPPGIRLDVPESDGNNFMHYKREWEKENE